MNLWKILYVLDSVARQFLCSVYYQLSSVVVLLGPSNEEPLDGAAARTVIDINYKSSSDGLNQFILFQTKNKIITDIVVEQVSNKVLSNLIPMSKMSNKKDLIFVNSFKH